MTNTHDLSLLTDGLERDAADVVLRGGSSFMLKTHGQLLLRALIAARAENKRKDEVIEFADALAYRATEYVSDIESAGGGDEHWKPLTHRLAEYKEQRALLQSEKGGE